MDAVIRGRPSVADLGDVELEAAVELGRTVLPLRQAGALKVGDVITLRKLAGEPVEVWVNGHRFGEGEIVCVGELMCCRFTRLEEPPEARLQDTEEGA